MAHLKARGRYPLRLRQRRYILPYPPHKPLHRKRTSTRFIFNVNLANARFNQSESLEGIYADAVSGAGGIGTFAGCDVGQIIIPGPPDSYFINQAGIEFNTSGLAGVTDAQLRVQISADVSDTDFIVNVYAYDWGTTLTSADWRTDTQLAALTLVATLDTSTIGSLVGHQGHRGFIPVGSALTSAINTTGETRFLLASSRNVSATAPTQGESLELALGSFELVVNAASYVPGTPATATPATIPTTATPLAPTISAGATVTPGVASVSATPLAASARAGQTASPATIAATATPQAPTKSAGSTKSPSLLSRQFDVNKVTIFGHFRTFDPFDYDSAPSLQGVSGSHWLDVVDGFDVGTGFITPDSFGSICQSNITSQFIGDFYSAKISIRLGTSGTHRIGLMLGFVEPDDFGHGYWGYVERTGTGTLFWAIEEVEFPFMGTVIANGTVSGGYVDDAELEVNINTQGDKIGLSYNGVFQGWANTGMFNDGGIGIVAVVDNFSGTRVNSFEGGYTAPVGATPTPTTIPLVVTQDAVSAGAGAAPAPDTINITATPLAPTTSAGATTSPTVILITATPLAPTASGSVDDTATPTVIPITGTPLAPTVSAGQTTSPAVIVATTTTPPASLSAGSTLTPSVISITGTPLAPIVGAGQTTSPGVILLAGPRVTDDFNRANTTPTSSAGDGLGTDWNAPQWFISGNMASRGSGGSPYALYLIPAATYDHMVEAVFVGTVGVQNPHYDLVVARSQITPEQNDVVGYIDPFDSKAHIGSRQGGSFADLGASAGTYDISGTYTLALECIGGTANLYHNGVLAKTQDISSLTNLGNYGGMEQGLQSADPAPLHENFKITSAMTQPVSAQAAAIASPTVIAITGTPLAPTVGAGATTSTTAIMAPATLNLPTVSAGQTTSPAVIAITGTPLAPTVTAGSTPTPATILTTITPLAPSVSAGSTLAPAVILVTGTPLAPTVSAGATSSPNTILATATPLAPSVSAGSTLTPATILATVTLPAVAASGSGSATAQPSAIPVTVTMGAPTLSAGQTTSPAVIAITATPLAPTLSAGQTTSPATILTVVALHTPTFSIGGTRAPATILTTVALGAVSLSVGSSLAMATITALVTLPAPTAGAGGTRAPDTILAAVAMGAVTATGGTSGTANPATIAALASLLAPTLSAGSTPAPNAILVPVTLGAPVASASSTLSPSTILAATLLNQASPSVGSTLLVATILGTFVMPPASAIGDGSVTATPGVIMVVLTTPSPFVPPQLIILVDPALVFTGSDSPLFVAGSDVFTGVPDLGIFNGDSDVFTGVDAPAVVSP